MKTKCPYCSQPLSAEVSSAPFFVVPFFNLTGKAYQCDEEDCRQFVSWVEVRDNRDKKGWKTTKHSVLPNSFQYVGFGGLVPRDIEEDFNEASSVLKASPRSCVVLTRRLLQKILKEKCGAKKANLVGQINEVHARESFDSGLRTDLHILRKIGNLGAHPWDPKKPRQEIIDASFKEGEWSLRVLRELIDRVYVQEPKKEKEQQEYLKGLNLSKGDD